jgi:phage gp36-like protein
VPYANQANLIDRYGQRELVQVTDKAVPPTGGIVAAVVDRALADADAEIDARLGLRYAVPLTAPVPPLVIDIACRIARYKLHEDRPSDKIRRDYEDAVKLLVDVAAGKAMIPGLAAPLPGSSGEGQNVGAYAVRAPEAVFTADLINRMP